jgi:CRISPR-associated endonuclease/helicase Cas3
MGDPFIAHYRESDKEPQTVKGHLFEVKKLAESYGSELNVSHITGLAGMLHDLGKYTDVFQKYLKAAVFNPETAPRRGSVDHASAGGKLLYQLLHKSGSRNQLKMLLAEIVGNAIISHHSYLHDYLNSNLESPFLKRVTKNEEQLPDYSEAKEQFFKEIMTKETLNNYICQAAEELKKYISKNPGKGNAIEKLTLLLRYVFSCLIDADRTNTRLFEENRVDESVDSEKLFSLYYQKLMDYLAKLNKSKGANTHINQLRKEMSLQCEEFAEKPSGIYTLSIPTGGGKTLASLRYALKHALLYHKKQIIYIVPYTTIIEQNAKVIRNILQDDEHILEHHSNVFETDENFNLEGDEGSLSIHDKLELAKDNWDCPIILTTMVQFLNTFYELGSKNIRRLHHLTDAVIIFDEVQKVPTHCVSLFNSALNFLKKFGRSSILLCTATQPALDYVHNRLEIDDDGEIVGHLSDVAQDFQRVQIVDRSYHETFNTERLTNFISELLKEVDSVLVILNTRSVVRKLYQALKETSQNISIFHLSTLMCAAHREEILKQINECLERKEKIICVSTQLIEAGVDVSFESVIRSLAGLDSIAQAAGRCNRNGEYDGLRKVYIIDHGEENLSVNGLEEIRKAKSVTKNIIAAMHRDPSSFEGNILSLTAMNWYFKNFFTEMGGKLDFIVPKLGESMTQLINTQSDTGFAKAYRMNHHNRRLPLLLVSSLRTAAENFYVIKNVTKSVLVPYGRGKKLIEQLGSAQSIDDLGRLFRLAQHYSINIYDQEFNKLEQNRQLAYYLDGQVIALNEGSYSEEFGLDIEGNGENEFYAY